MPVIAFFLGITIKMYFQLSEHNPPHVHVEYGGHACAMAIADGALLDGTLPLRQQRYAREWIDINREELRSMWETQEFRRLPGVV